jgi:Plastocyanin
MVTITMQNLRFNPGTVTVAMGSTVTWVNNDPQSLPHTATSDSGLWDSGRMNVGSRYSRKFDKPGTYPYHCTFHQGEGMVGTIIVR